VALVARRTPDLPSLVAGIAIAIFGTVLLLDQADVLDLRFGALAPLVCVLGGAILLATGLSRRD
jgi:hypothetical protein